jgi:hypothetical protein
MKLVSYGIGTSEQQQSLKATQSKYTTKYSTKKRCNESTDPTKHHNTSNAQNKPNEMRATTTTTSNNPQ